MPRPKDGVPKGPVGSRPGVPALKQQQKPRTMEQSRRFLGCCLGARSRRPRTAPTPSLLGKAGRWTADDDAGFGRLADIGVPVAACGTKPARQRRGQHLSLLAGLQLFSAEAAAAANCHGHQVTGTRRQPPPAGPKDGRGGAERGGGGG